MKDVQAAVAAYLAETLGIPAVEERSRCQQYPMLAVTVRENGTVLLAGGRLVEHSYQAEVTAASDRERETAAALLERVSLALLRGVPMGDRVLHPLQIRTEGDKLHFDVTICRAVPSGGDGGQAELMRTVHMAVRETQ